MTESDFTKLVNENKGIIIKVIRLYIRNVEDERDLFQEIVFQAWKASSNFRGDSKFSTWLYRISLNTVLTYNRRPRLAISIEDLPSVSSRAAEAGNVDESEALYLAMLNLSEVDRLILSLHLDGYENEEIAETVGISKNNTAVRLHRAKENVIQEIKKEER